MSCYDVWYVDGTFKVCPKIFYQLFNINLRIGGKSVPLLSSCLYSKEEVEYDKCFSHISSHIKTHPRLIVADFEKAILNSIARNICSIELFFLLNVVCVLTNW